MAGRPSGLLHPTSFPNKCRGEQCVQVDVLPLTDSGERFKLHQQPSSACDSVVTAVGNRCILLAAVCSPRASGRAGSLYSVRYYIVRTWYYFSLGWSQHHEPAESASWRASQDHPEGLPPSLWVIRLPTNQGGVNQPPARRSRSSRRRAPGKKRLPSSLHQAHALLILRFDSQIPCCRSWLFRAVSCAIVVSFFVCFFFYPVRGEQTADPCSRAAR